MDEEEQDGAMGQVIRIDEVRNVSLLLASAVSSEGCREILGICEGAREDRPGWSFAWACAAPPGRRSGSFPAPPGQPGPERRAADHP